MSQVVQTKTLSAVVRGRGARPIIQFVGITFLTLLVFESGSTWAENLKRLSGVQIRARFSNMQLTDEVHWREVYQRDGSVRSYSMGKLRTGKWFVRADDFCVDLPEPDGGCYEVKSSGSRIVMTPKGTGLTIEGVLQPISDASNSAAWPNLPTRGR
ncbi:MULTISPECIES: hypothetical protein [Hyphomicrobiales]|jgi:hypothetical protein|uniref:hypothetical protein n=1 Tax=Hyphomicrobiales TaxID=356 RepID=UPI0012EB6154|nr:hypothetical protein [Afipia birgiae]